jgi:hypothetical protein
MGAREIVTDVAANSLEEDPSEDRVGLFSRDPSAQAITQASTITDISLDGIKILDDTNNIEGSRPVLPALATSLSAIPGGSSEKQRLVAAEISLTTPNGNTTLMSLESPIYSADLSLPKIKSASRRSREQVFPPTPPRLPARPLKTEKKIEPLPPTPPVVPARPKTYRKRTRTREPRSIQALITAEKAKSKQSSVGRVGREGQQDMVLPDSIQKHKLEEDIDSTSEAPPLVKAEPKLEAPAQITRPATVALDQCDKTENVDVNLVSSNNAEFDNPLTVLESTEISETPATCPLPSGVSALAEQRPANSPSTIEVSMPSLHSYPPGQLPLPPLPRAPTSTSDEHNKAASLPIRPPLDSDSQTNAGR